MVHVMEEKLALFKRIVVVVLDSVGAGAMPDAAEYGDAGANTLGNIARSQGGLFLPTLEKLGLGCITEIDGVRQDIKPIAWYGKMAEISTGKDTTTGHWEMAGCPVFTPFPVYPDGFPATMIEKITAITGRQVIGNKAASGTEIIAELGDNHVNTGSLIIYTSADSVLQIAAHEEVVPLEELYLIGKRVRREVCIGEHAVGRVIVRPFIGSPGKFIRTPNRHDYSLEPPALTVLELLARSGREVVGVGKISDIFSGRGITKSYPTKSNDDGIETVVRLLTETNCEGLVMANLVEFDSLYGHRNDSVGYAKALERLDGQLELVISLLKDADLLIVTADHGCDPTTKGTDHTREYVPLIACYKGCSAGELGVRRTFADIAATIAENFSLGALEYGNSFLGELYDK
ncbi:MAG: deoB [Firmicutes bacterium]|nr:deoB [Bacillota bacterium]